MPRKIQIKRSPNPTHLSMEDRRLAIEVLQSLEKSVLKVRTTAYAEKQMYRGRRADWTAEDEQMVRTRVYRSAIRQLQGAQASEGSYFSLEREVPDADMEYVRNSLGL